MNEEPGSPGGGQPFYTRVVVGSHKDSATVQEEMKKLQRHFCPLIFAVRLLKQNGPQEIGISTRLSC